MFAAAEADFEPDGSRRWKDFMEVQWPTVWVLTAIKARRR
jgi:hypothetical protein